jgi:hypothetical protein
MVETIRGISQESDIQSLADAESLLELSDDYTVGDVDEAVQQKSLEAHPDQGGTQELFKAVQSAGDVAKGNEGVPPSAAPSDQRTVQTQFGPSATGTGPSTDFSTADVSRRGDPDFSDFGGVAEEEDEDSVGPDRSQIKLAIIQALGEDFDEQTIQEELGFRATVDEFVEILTDLVINGTITLASIAATVGQNKNFGDKRSDPRFGNSDPRFGRSGSNVGGSDSNFGSGDSNFSKKGGGNDNFG